MPVAAFVVGGVICFVLVVGWIGDLVEERGGRLLRVGCDRANVGERRVLVALYRQVAERHDADRYDAVHNRQAPNVVTAHCSAAVFSRSCGLSEQRHRLARLEDHTLALAGDARTPSSRISSAIERDDNRRPPRPVTKLVEPSHGARGRSP